MFLRSTTIIQQATYAVSKPRVGNDSQVSYPGFAAMSL